MTYDPNQQQPGPAYGYPGPQPQAPSWGQPAPTQTGPVGKFKTWNTGQKVGVGCGGAFGIVFVLALIGAATGDSGTPTPAPTVTATVTKTVPGPTVTVTATPAAAPAPEAKPSDAPKPADTPAPAPAPATGTLPNFVGQQLQAAQDGAQAAGFYFLDSTDASGAGRMQVLDRNWKVCSQTPKAGTYDLTTRVTFDTVKTDETCP
ncbi:hypothetical protein MTF65_14015 [Streptomyces sp. APSN-46.1]|uniref:hypothetical protein n=1 Tax=Streptomyces sp. APSN-46.1 TaxID=2929049 RepID=UPI001FB3F8E5|nr:hypothetical protein [Streptomyces sp. APSN-46.1]MCJ1678443.1 hypothetical protein [Streptomyces sp. APSN-46.1]